MKTTVSQEILSPHQEQELLLSLREAGLSSEDAQRVIGSRDNALAKRVVDFIRNGGYEVSTDQKLARSIMGKSFLGIEEVSEHFGVSFTEEQMLKLTNIPLTEAELQECRDTHLLVAGYSMSFSDVRRIASWLFYGSHDAWSWYQEYAFVINEKMDVRWYLLRKNVVYSSTDKTWSDQQAMLAEDEEIPRACEVIYAVILYALVTGVRLLPNTYVRTASVNLGDVVIVGNFDQDGLIVTWWDYDSDYDIGLSSSRKINV